MLHRVSFDALPRCRFRGGTPSGAALRLPQPRHQAVLRVACRCASDEADSQSLRRGVLRTVDWGPRHHRIEYSP